MKRLLLLLPLLALLQLGGPANAAQPYVLEIALSGDEEVPAVQTHAWGFIRFYFNEDRTEADVTSDIKGYSTADVTGSDIHRGAPGQTGPVVVHLADAGFIVASTRVTFTPELLQEFASGGLYASIKTVNHPQGEIRGQIVVPADFLPSTSTRPAQPAAAPAAPAPRNPGGISPPNTGDAGLR